jgi:hypothetical protein
VVVCCASSTSSGTSDILAKVTTIERDLEPVGAHRAADYADGEKRYILHPA